MATATFKTVAPIFATADLQAMQSHYEALGFTMQVHQSGYATASRDGVNLHFRHEPDPAATAAPGAAYFAVDDADALHAEWVAAGVGETSDLFDPGFGVLEGVHTDPDGNLLRFGSPLRHPDGRGALRDGPPSAP
jgi:glyoxalase/bleomycin resistance protein/dioxygenase superfamily protein